MSIAERQLDEIKEKLRDYDDPEEDLLEDEQQDFINLTRRSRQTE
jgi:hypothetical protein